MGIVEQFRSDSGPDLDILDLIKRDLDPAAGREEGIDLSVDAELGDEYQCTEAADERDGKSEK